MTIAATQLREYLEAKYPGVRISRLNCRDTAGGSISQHSAYDGYDSNALDVMGGPLGRSFDENVGLINTIVDDVTAHWSEWSIRLILWQVPDHFGHAHIDFYPTCATRKWCGRDIVPRWRSSTGASFYSTDPEPENGRYEGNDEMLTFADWANGLFDHIDDDEIVQLREAGYWIPGDPNDVAAADQYWLDLRDKGTAGRTPGERDEVARFVQTCEVSAWLNAAPRMEGPA